MEIPPLPYVKIKAVGSTGIESKAWWRQVTHEVFDLRKLSLPEHIHGELSVIEFLSRFTTLIFKEYGAEVGGTATTLLAAACGLSRINFMGRITGHTPEFDLPNEDAVLRDNLRKIPLSGFVEMVSIRTDLAHALIAEWEHHPKRKEQEARSQHLAARRKRHRAQPTEKLPLNGEEEVVTKT